MHLLLSMSMYLEAYNLVILPSCTTGWKRDPINDFVRGLCESVFEGSTDRRFIYSMPCFLAKSKNQTSFSCLFTIFFFISSVLRIITNTFYFLRSYNKS